ncbi:hypothetical protein [Streptomyces sp. NPDC001652]|uniref:hypothetical protein n=1 Tax=Streptomyces sp. NPDC001652 TaxID=3154393 RepID=UPI003334536D
MGSRGHVAALCWEVSARLDPHRAAVSERNLPGRELGSERDAELRGITPTLTL